MSLIQGQSFPEYVYQEYPKWITLPDGKKIIVESKTKETELLGIFPTQEEIVADPAVVAVIEMPKEIIPQVTTDKQFWIDRAEELGIIYKRSWGIERFQEAIKAAESYMSTESEESEETQE